MSWHENEDGADRAMARLAGFRGELHRSLGTRRDALFEVADALACRPERVHMLAELCLEPECRRGLGGVYDALNCGEVRIGRPRRAVAGIALRRRDDGRIRLAGVLFRCYLFAFRMSYSGKAVHLVSATCGQEAFLEGHVHAFAVLGGVPAGQIRYDNLTPAVTKVLRKGRARIENPRWTAFRSHYLLTQLQG
jgi:hypothetical protein